jgi:cysteinyl-tRNA synthetase
VKKTKLGFLEEMDDDINTRGAIAELFELARETNKLMHHEMLSKKGAKSIIALFEEFDQILGILPGMEHGPDQFDDIMEIIVNVRQELRKRKLYDLADKIRDSLAEKGVILEDTVEGVKWKLD